MWSGVHFRASSGYAPPLKAFLWGAMVTGHIAEGFRVLAAIAAGAHGPAEITARLELRAAPVAVHLDALIAGGFVRRDGDRLVLGERATRLLDRLVGRSDLLEIAWPIVAEAESRLGGRIEIDLPDADDEAGVPYDGTRFSLGKDRSGERAVVAWVLDGYGEAACVLRTRVDGSPSETIEVLGKELVATADAISARLPRRKHRGRAYSSGS